MLAPCDSSDHMLMRLVDDYIFVSTDRAAAEIFLANAVAGIPTYGCQVKAEKSNQTLNLIRIRYSVESGYHGADYFFGNPSMEVRLDMDSLVRSTISLSFDGDATTTIGGHDVCTAMKTIVASKCFPILLDDLINSKDNIVFNIVQIFGLCASRLIDHVRAVGSVRVVSAVECLVSYACTFIYSKQRELSSKDAISKFELTSIGIATFAKILSSKKGQRVVGTTVVEAINVLLQARDNLRFSAILDCATKIFLC